MQFQDICAPVADLGRQDGGPTKVLYTQLAQGEIDHLMGD